MRSASLSLRDRLRLRTTATRDLPSVERALPGRGGLLIRSFSPEVGVKTEDGERQSASHGPPTSTHPTAHGHGRDAGMRVAKRYVSPRPPPPPLPLPIRYRPPRTARRTPPRRSLARPSRSPLPHLSPRWHLTAAAATTTRPHPSLPPPALGHQRSARGERRRRRCGRRRPAAIEGWSERVGIAPPPMLLPQKKELERRAQKKTERAESWPFSLTNISKYW